MRTIVAAVLVALILTASAAAQRPEPQGAVGPRYQPKIAYYARDICDWQDVNLDLLDHVVGLLLDDVDDDPEIMTARLTEISARQAVIDGLIADARVQDPGFQCYLWDFSPPEHDGSSSATPRRRWGR